MYGKPLSALSSTEMQNRVGYLMSSDARARRRGIKFETCGLGLRSDNCLDKPIEALLCSLYFKRLSCSVTIPHHSFANHSCSKKLCSACSQYLEQVSQDVNESFVQKSKSPPKNLFRESGPRTSRQKRNEREEEPICRRCLYFVFFHIETEQSCDIENDLVPVLLRMQN